MSFLQRLCGRCMSFTIFSALVLVLADHLYFAAALPRPRYLPKNLGSGSGAGGSDSSVKSGMKATRKLQRPFMTVAKESLRKDLLEQCTERWRNATLDHFSTNPPPGGITTFAQRYFVCANHWQQPGPDSPSGPIFFYLGNEADVTLYLNNSGLMWESAPDFGAMLVFAEHRYYGESVPYGKDVQKHMHYLIAEQAMADYAELIMELKEEFDAQDSRVIGFGGSYGGMLAAWMRLKYPHVLDGAIAASAPIWNFIGETPPFDFGSFAKGVTYDATEVGGSAPACADNVRGTWDLLRIYGGDQSGRDFLADSLRLCPDVELKSEEDVLYLRAWLGGAWDYMAMGNFPYPSSYITNGHGLLPAFPVRVACSFLAAESPADQELLDAMSQAAGVFYNHTGDVTCFDPFGGTDPDSDKDANFWDFQWCAEMLMPFEMNGVDDMFWPEPFDLEAAIAACQEHWGVTPRPLRATTEWGGRRISAGSNIVFSNGLLDPWHGGGVLEDISDSMPAVIIPEGAHHLDLMFSNPDDPLSVIEVRKFQRESIRDWITVPAQQKRQQQQQPRSVTDKPALQVQQPGDGASVMASTARSDAGKAEPGFLGRPDGASEEAAGDAGSEAGIACVMRRLWWAAKSWVGSVLGWSRTEGPMREASGAGGWRKMGDGRDGSVV